MIDTNIIDVATKKINEAGYFTKIENESYYRTYLANLEKGCIKIRFNYAECQGEGSMTIWINDLELFVGGDSAYYKFENLIDERNAFLNKLETAMKILQREKHE